MQGGIIDKEMPIHISNVMLVCKNCGPTRVGFTFTDLGKVRVCKKCGDEV
jgi:large subunit ribosomal protein L24